MAREPRVSRTIKTTEVTILCLDLETAEPYHRDLSLPRTYKTDDDILKAASKQINDASHRAVHVVDKEIKQRLYYMSEATFLQHAKAADETEPEENEQTILEG